MPVNKRIGYGILLDVDSAGGTNFTNVGTLVDGTEEADAKADTGETSILIDVFKTKSKGQIDPGEVTFMVAFDPDESSYQLMVSLLAQVTAVPPNWRIRLPVGTLGNGTITSKTFQAHLTGMGRKMKMKELIVAPITLTKTGNPGM